MSDSNPSSDQDDTDMPVPTPDEQNVEAPAPDRATVIELMTTPSRSIRPHGMQSARDLAAAAAKVALDNNGSNVIVLDVTGQTSEFDLFLIATGTSRRQLHAISEQIDDALQKDLGDHRQGIEGYEESSWIVLDYGNVVIHLFDEETRQYYDLESLWADGVEIPLSEFGLAEED